MVVVQDENPCIPSPCGRFAHCNVHQSRPVCSCFANYLGRPPNCRPECLVNSDCSMHLACVNERCVDVCGVGVCGINAECTLIASHQSYCQCVTGFTGDPFNGCVKIVTAVQSKLPIIKYTHTTLCFHFSQSFYYFYI